MTTYHPFHHSRLSKRRESIFVSLLVLLLPFTVDVFDRAPSIFLSEAFSVPRTSCDTKLGRCRDSAIVIFSNRNENNGKGNDGYRFGDFTRGAINRFQGRVNSLTGKPKYEFGDLSRWIDTKAKQSVENFTNKPDYQFGDISKEIIRRLVNGEYDRDDLLLLLKIVATIGINMQPVARVLPMKVLMDLLNLSLEASIAQTVGHKVITSITNEIDARMKEMVTGDRSYQLGDYTKRIVNRWTGKEAYEFGDVTKTILGRMQEREDNSRIKDTSTEAIVAKANETLSANEIVLELDKTEQDALDEWDKEFFKYQREKEGLGSLQDDDLYRDWDERYLAPKEQSRNRS